MTKQSTTFMQHLREMPQVHGTTLLTDDSNGGFAVRMRMIH